MRVQNNQNKNVSFKAFLWKKEYNALQSIAEIAVKGVFLEEYKHPPCFIYFSREQKETLKQLLYNKNADELLLTQKDTKKLMDLNTALWDKRARAKNKKEIKLHNEIVNESISKLVNEFLENSTEIPFEKYQEWSKTLHETTSKIADDFRETFKDKLF